MLVSSPSYPNTIYGMPLIAKDVQIRFELEFKFKFELNQKRNGKRKRRKKKREGPDPLGLASAKGPISLSPAQVSKDHAAETNEKQKKETGQAPHWTRPMAIYLLLGPGRQTPCSY